MTKNDKPWLRMPMYQAVIEDSPAPISIEYKIILCVFALLL